MRFQPGLNPLQGQPEPLRTSRHGALTRAVARGVACGALLLTAAASSWAQTPPDPYNYTRTSSWAYYGTADGAKNGLLKSETVEPDNIASCVVTTYDYDAYGNKKSVTTANCAGSVPARQQFTSRTANSTFDPATPPTVSVNGTSVTLPRGAFAYSSANALSQSENKEYDPRFGIATKLTGPNGLVTTWTLDNLGRVTKELRADGTSTVNYYCYISGRVSDTSTNSDPTVCASATEAPLEAVSFVQSQPLNTAGAKMGAFSRTYSDRQGRTIRTVTESFDGASQTATLKGVAVVQDVVYNAYGAKVLTTQPYFLSSGASTTIDANQVGVSRTDYDTLGRPIAVYMADANGSVASQTFGTAATTVSYGQYGNRKAAKTSFAYDGLSTTITNDKGQARKEERDPEGHPIRITDANSATLAHQYDAFGNLVVTKDALQNQITLKYDIRGRKVELNDPDTGLWKYDYDALGQLVWQESPNQRVAAKSTTMAYDVLGRMTSRVEPEGTTTWTYDKYADTTSCMKDSGGGFDATKARGKLCEVKVQRPTASDYFTRKFVYDNLGRAVNTRTTVNGGPSFASAAAYDGTTGRVSSTTYPTGLKAAYGYTTLGYLEKLTLPSGATVNPLPSTAGGAAGASATLPANAVLWQASVVNAWGRTEKQVLGTSSTGLNAVTSNAAFEALTGRPTSLKAGIGTATTVLNQTYAWDSLNNLLTRADANGDGTTGAVNELFVYTDDQGVDKLNRLRKYTVNGQGVPGGTRTVTLDYNALGLLRSKNDVGTYNYPTSGSGVVRPHAVQTVVNGGTTTSYTYDANGNLVTASGGKYRTISYNSFNLPDSQTGIGGASGGSYGGTAKYTWTYDESHARMAETRTITGGTMAGTRTTWNLHPDASGGLSYEYEDNVPTAPSASNPAVKSHRHYLSVGGQAIGVLVTTGTLPTLVATQTAPTELTTVTLVKVEFWHKDQLGSLTTTTDHTGAVTARFAYDPFGKRRYTNGVYDASGNLVIDWSAATNNGDDRGFTGHEHLDDIGIVHMNGRLFDPNLGIFLQGDPFIQDSTDLQNYNRYGYCLNNPMTCTDPSGFFGWKRLGRSFGTMLFSTSPAKVARAGMDFLHNQPGQSQVDAYITTHAWANQLGQAVVTYFTWFCGGCGGYAWSAYYTYQATGSLSAAGRAAAVAYVSAELFAAAGTVGDAGSIGRYAAHAVAGCASAEISGGNCGQGALSAVAGKAMTNALGGWETQRWSGEDFAKMGVTMIAGGTASVIGGGKFSSGALSASYGYIYNNNFALRASYSLGRMAGKWFVENTELGQWTVLQAANGIEAVATRLGGLTLNEAAAAQDEGAAGKSRNKPPDALPEAEGRPHSIVERPGPEGQYTTHNGDGTGKQYRGEGQDHGGIPRPNVKEWGSNTAPDGRVFIDKGRVRPVLPGEIPGK